MENNQPPKKKFFTDRNITLIIRWWAAGAVYFFIGWGTNLGLQQGLIDFVLTLGVVIALFNILILNRVLRAMFNIGADRPKVENIYAQRLSDYLVELLKNIFIVGVVVMIYAGLNAALIRLRSLPEDAVPLPGEPILFGVFYIFVFWLLDLIYRWIKGMLTDRKTEGESE